MGKVPRGWWFGGFQLCSFLSPKMECTARAEHSSFSQPTGTAQPVATRSLAVSAS